ncbi:hypothetical protein RUM43_013294 [Polyplax serrata]|uniref:RanBD1 domain-containing protein n=1 Tax=Polyplax serrata TaxID=468196 RepID=A0AAN8NXM9_POLSC
MSKRTATSSLNQDNWDQEEETEEPGVFQAASSEVLQSRVIRTAKRRMKASDNDLQPKQSPFSSFAGFKTTSTFTSNSPFSFLNQMKGGADNKDKTKNGAGQETISSFSVKDTAEETNIFSGSPFQSVGQKKDSDMTDSLKQTKTTEPSVFKPFEHIFNKTSHKSQNKDEYMNKTKNLDLLRDLNLSCSNWIADHLKKNPYCILTPIFRDYEKHLGELNIDNGDICGKPVSEEANDGNKQIEAEPVLTFEKSKKEIAKPFSFSKDEATDSNQEEQSTTKDKQNEFKFEGFPLIKPLNHQFGSGNSMLSSTPSTFSLNNIAAKPICTEVDSKKDDEDTEEPPTTDFVPVVEEDSIFDIKCKVFVKKEGNFVSRGVGTLFLKPVKDSGKTQVVVRAHTSLGNILLNILLTSGMPIQKTGKNNAMIVCIPTPDSQPPPVPVLIRVKTSEECDVLIKKLEDCRRT